MSERHSGGLRSDPLRSLATLVAVLALATGCQASSPSSAPIDVPSPTASRSTQPPPTSASTPTPVGWRWEPAGVMAIGRARPNAVLLGDGRVLVVGGSGFSWENVDDDSARVELWDPATGAWQATESLNKPRSAFALVPLADGGALVTGGLNQTAQSYSSTYVYDPRPGRDSWSKVGLLDKARTLPAAAALLDGRVLVAGGYFHVERTFGRADRSRTERATDPRTSFPQTALAGPRLADIEAPPVGAALATAELFDPATGSWSATGALAFARFGAAAVTLADGRILVFGSASMTNGVVVDAGAYDTAEIYDPQTGRFSAAGRLPDINREALESAGAPGADPVPEDAPDVGSVGSLVALDDGGALLVGHGGWWKHVGDITRSFRFDAGAGTWTEIGQTYIYVVDQGDPTPVALESPGARMLAEAIVTRLSDGRVLVAGGGVSVNYGVTPLAMAELYDPAANTWSPLPPMPAGSAGGAAVVLPDGSVLVVGGYAYGADGSFSASSSAVRLVSSP